jgi:Cu/Ag efflux pump CusA
MRADEEGLEDIRQTPLKESDGAVVRVRDVASVAIGGEIRQGASTLTTKDDEGKPIVLGEVVTGQVLKRLGANTDTTIQGLQERVPLIEAALPKGVKFEVIYDQSDLIQKASPVQRAKVRTRPQFILASGSCSEFSMTPNRSCMAGMSRPTAGEGFHRPIT